MEFWGVEVKPNQSLKCEPGKDKLLHLSLVSLGETKKAAENVVVSVTVDDKKFVIGTLFAEKCPQISQDLVFEKEFELSHSSKSASVYFVGYNSIAGDEIPSDYESSEEDETELVEIKDAPKSNGALKEKPKADEDKVIKTKAGKQNKPPQPAADSDSDEDEDSDDDDENMMDADSSEEEDDSSEEEEENADDSSEEEEEETPKPAKGKKRPAEAVKKAPESEKKAKLTTPADGKKGEAKKGAATPAKSDKGKQQTPKSAVSGSVSCKSCPKTFNSEGALESHTKAKHAAK